MKKNNNIEAIIFDMDGTLYHFDDGESAKFRESSFGKTINSNVLSFFMSKFSLSKEEAVLKINELDERYKGEISLGLEKEFGIPRSEYFAFTWDLIPEEFLKTNSELLPLIESVPVQSVLLSAAPKVWVDRVLNFLNIQQFFNEAIFTGDPDLRKPDPMVFQMIADFLNLAPHSIISIGDQEHTDILPAKSIGMMTVKIGAEESQADFVVNNVSEAIALLKKEGII